MLIIIMVDVEVYIYEIDKRHKSFFVDNHEKGKPLVEGECFIILEWEVQWYILYIWTYLASQFVFVYYSLYNKQMVL